MHYLVDKAVKQKIHEHEKQITKEALHALDVKIEIFLHKLCHQHNGSSKRIDAGLVRCLHI